MTNMQRMKKVAEIIETEIAPKLQNDGGNIELVDIDGVTVYVKLQGRCAHCAGAKATLANLVQKKLRETVDPEITVVEG